MTGTMIGVVNARAGVITSWLVVAICCSVPVSTVLDSVLLGLLLIAFLLSGQLREKLQTVAQNPAALSLLGLFVLLLVGTLGGMAPLEEQFKSLGKYSDFLFVVLLIPFFLDDRTCVRALTAFGVAMALTLMFLLLLFAGLLPRRKASAAHLTRGCVAGETPRG